VLAQQRIRIATAWFVSVWVMQDKGLLTRRDSLLLEWRPPRSRRSSATAGIFPVDLGADQAIYLYNREKEWTKALIGRYLEVNDPVSLEGFQQLENDSL
jgi:hypothetical protein